MMTLGIVSSNIDRTLIKNKYTANSLMKDNIQNIEYSNVLKNNGGIQVINQDYNIIFSKGINNFSKKQLTISEFTEFLTRSQNIERDCSYSIAYNENKHFWLIVTFPTSIRIDLKVTHNSLYSSTDTNVVTCVIIFAIVAYFLLLYISTLIYSRLTASAFTKQLAQLIEGANKLSNGDYSARVNLKTKTEVGDLGQSFNKMANQIQNEIILKEKSENIRKQLTLDIAHDLKNPLAVIMGYAEYCHKNPSQNNEAYLNIIYHQSSRANTLINRLFELSKLESPEYQLDKQKCDFSEYLRMKCASLIQTFETAGFLYDFDIQEDELNINVDIKEIDRVFDNLFENTLRYNKKGTKVNLELKDMDKTIQIILSDNGKGIPKDLTENIFKPFVRTDEARNTETGGNGLGLAIVEKIIKMHQGEIQLESDTGKGCKFTISLPKK